MIPASILLSAGLSAEQSAEGQIRCRATAVAEHEVDDGAFHQVSLIDRVTDAEAASKC